MTRRFAAAACLLLLAGGCATVPPAGDARDWPAERAALQSLERWSLDGRIAVAAGEDGFSGGFDWSQSGDIAEIVLSGPLGGSALRIHVEGGEAIVSTGQGVVVEDPTALLARYLGPERVLPAAEMRYWLLGVPAPHAPSVETPGADRRLAALSQSGWQVRFDRYEGIGRFALPARMEMTTEGLRLRIVVSDWQLPP